MTLIILLIILGILLMLAEIFVVPGIGIVGVIGLICLSAGVYFAYEESNVTGHAALGGTVVLCAGLTYLAFKSSTWKKMMVKTELHGKTNSIEEHQIEAGNEGLSISRLAPMGKARINERIVEVKSFNDFIDEDEPIVVLRVEGNLIVVKQKNS